MRSARRSALAAALICAAVLPAGCNAISEAVPRPTVQSARRSPDTDLRYAPEHRGGTLTVLATRSAGSIDPQTNYTAQYWEIFQTVYDGLLAFRQVPGDGSFTMVPDLAVALPQVQNGGLRYVFALRQGIAFSNGRTVTATDVAASLLRMFQV